MHNILIIDDDLGVCETLSDILREDGYRVVSAGTGAEGLQNSKKEAFQVVLLDLRLPNKDGLSILRDLLELKPEQKVVVITGHATMESAITALNEGAYAYITKPFDMRAVKAFIKKAIEQYELAAQKKEAEEQVRRLKEYNENILTSLPYALIIFNQSRNVEYVNSVYLKDFNLEKEAVIERDLFETPPFTSLQGERIKKDVEGFLSGKAIDPQEIKIDQRTFGYRLFYVFKGTLEIQKAGLIIRDVTHEKKLQQQLIQSEKLAGIGTMAMGIAHEVNNPLFGIMGLAEAILDEVDPNVIKEYTRDIIKYSKATSAIVRGLTIYSRSTEAGEMGLVDVNEKLNEALKVARHSVQFDGIEVTKEYSADKKIMINSGELQQAFVNIINNAAQAMNGKGRLLLSTGMEENFMVIRISDNGPGIPKEQIRKIFEPFFTTKDPDKGTGLGLNIAYRIVEKYNGRIGVESEEGKGATFVVKFPIGE